MNIYKKMYLHLFNAVTDILPSLKVQKDAAGYLCKTQQECEEMFINYGEKGREMKNSLPRARGESKKE